MNFKEFSKFYDDIIGFEDEFNKNHKIAENGESLVDFICDELYAPHYYFF